LPDLCYELAGAREIVYSNFKLLLEIYSLHLAFFPYLSKGNTAQFMVLKISILQGGEGNFIRAFKLNMERSCFSHFDKYEAWALIGVVDLEEEPSGDASRVTKFKFE
jgi:hypothetical protein